MANFHQPGSLIPGETHHCPSDLSTEIPGHRPTDAQSRPVPTSLSWIEISASALTANARTFRSLIGQEVKLYAVVKANAYGHGVEIIAPAAIAAGADGLAVYSAGEGLHLRALGITAPVLTLGYVPRSQLEAAVAADLDITVFTKEALEAAAAAAQAVGRQVRIHLKVETGTHRQGMYLAEFIECLNVFAANRWLHLQGVSTHFANIEDTTEHSFAHSQQLKFDQYLACAAARDMPVPVPHTACTAAAMLFPSTYFKAVRVGIGIYGLWPSKETYLSSLQLSDGNIRLQPVLTWRTIVSQVKVVPAGAYIGYGCTFRATRETTIALLPIGYADGYARQLSNAAHVLIHGKRAPVRGRICMNVTMADVSDHGPVTPEDEVILLGRQGDETVSAEYLAGLCGTINYEFVTRISPAVPRRLVP